MADFLPKAKSIQSKTNKSTFTKREFTGELKN